MPKSAALPILAVIPGLLFAGVPPDGGKGRIQVIGPPEIEIFLDGESRGTTASGRDGLILGDVPAGEHAVRAEKEGCIPREEKVVLKGKEVRRLTLKPLAKDPIAGLLPGLALAAIGVNPQGLPEYRHGPTGIIFVRLPGGKFLMGAQKKDPKGPNHDSRAQEDEGPVHEVTLRPFLIAKHELTQGQWKAAMGSNPARFPGDDRRPIEQVSWKDIQSFEEKTGLGLPTEAQWEFACRAGSQTPSGKEAEDAGWNNTNSGAISHPVGERPPNRFGLFDMIGNMSEWCEDAYDEGFYGKPEAKGPDPVAASGSDRRISRGGAWGYPPLFNRASQRWHMTERMRDANIGFRPIRPLPETAAPPGR